MEAGCGEHTGPGHPSIPRPPPPGVPRAGAGTTVEVSRPRLALRARFPSPEQTGRKLEGDKCIKNMLGACSSLGMNRGEPRPRLPPSPFCHQRREERDRRGQEGTGGAGGSGGPSLHAVCRNPDPVLPPAVGAPRRTSVGTSWCHMLSAVGDDYFYPISVF